MTLGEWVFYCTALVDFSKLLFWASFCKQFDFVTFITYTGSVKDNATLTAKIQVYFVNGMATCSLLGVDNWKLNNCVLVTGTPGEDGK